MTTFTENNIDLEKICTEARSVVSKVAAFIKEESVKVVEENIITKGRNNFVTYVDIQAEKTLVEGLREILPEAGFITEENTPNEEGEYVWVIIRWTALLILFIIFLFIALVWL